MKSRKPSGLNNPSPDPLVFFLDECTDGLSIAEPLSAAGLEIRRHRDHFQSGTPDDVWIPAVASRGWVILTLDSQQFIRPLEIRQLFLSGAREFVIRGKGIKGAERASRVIANRRRIANICASQPAPFIAYITRNSVEVKYRARDMKQAARRAERRTE